MQKFFAKHRNLWRSVLFLCVLAVVLEGLSQLSLALDRNHNPLYNYSARGLFEEPENTIDVLAIGTSNIYSSIEPLEWWRQSGITGFAWGEPAQRIYDTYEYLREIYQRQSPKVVLIDVSNAFRDETDAQNLDSMVKTQISRVFPIVTYHRDLTPKKLANWGADSHSVTKGYMLRCGTQKPETENPYMDPTDLCADCNPLAVRELKKCLDLCQKHGSSVILVAIPDYNSWDRTKHNTVEQLAEQWQAVFLDLNEELANSIDWTVDSPDGGNHLNYKGAAKVTDYLCQYLQSRETLPDHRGDPAYNSWEEDAGKFFAKIDAIQSKAS